MNLPNRLTVARLFLTLLFVAALSFSWPYAYVAGLVFFVLAGITDYLDGEIARRWKLETNFGRLMDPLADKILLAAAFICLVEARAFPGWVAIVIVSREFLITGLRLLAASRGVVLVSDKAGKHKTAWQIVMVIFYLLVGAIQSVVAVPLVWLDQVRNAGGPLLIALVLVLTLYSGLGYLWRNRRLLREQEM